MKKPVLVIAAGLLVFAFTSCSKKTYPAENTTAAPASTSTTTATGSTTTTKKVTPVSATVYNKEQARKAQQSGVKPPQVIVVNDKAAGKTADGKLYYDLNGYRYWKNNKDGKYYLDGIYKTPAKKD
ncbi:MAG: hypothetical protein JWQ27_318 [Ferruginibacter sp.]|nr:hypothetical protein [Ferruginibacter sp.]